MSIPQHLKADPQFCKDVRSRRLGFEAIARKYGGDFSRDDVRILRKRLRDGWPAIPTVGTLPVESLDESHEYSGDSWQISLPRTRIKTLEQLVEACEVDTDLWEVERFLCNKWEVGARNREGAIDVAELFQVKAWLKKRREVSNVAAVVENLVEKARKHAPRYRKVAHGKSPRTPSILLEISPFDLHLGKLCWGEESGKDYDLNIARQVWEESVTRLVELAGGFHIGRIVLVIGQDFFNVDNSKNQTTGGTPQDEDSRWQKSFITAEEMVVEAVDQLRLTAPVEIKVVPGNHDTERAFYLGRMLAAWYSRCPDVAVDCGPGTRKIIHYGRNLIMLTHGDKEKHATLPLLMAQEYPHEWADSHFREVHTGHLHQKRETRYTEEYNAVRVRILPSLSAADAWHSGKGFKSLPAAEAFAWHAEDGLVAQFSHTPRISSEASE